MRTSTRRRSPSGLTKAWMRSSPAMSWAYAGKRNAAARVAAASVRIVFSISRSVVAVRVVRPELLRTLAGVDLGCIHVALGVHRQIMHPVELTGHAAVATEPVQD